MRCDAKSWRCASRILAAEVLCDALPRCKNTSDAMLRCRSLSPEVPLPFGFCFLWSCICRVLGLHVITSVLCSISLLRSTNQPFSTIWPLCSSVWLRFMHDMVQMFRRKVPLQPNSLLFMFYSWARISDFNYCYRCCFLFSGMNFIRITFLLRKILGGT